jgi:hypothetical protein
MRAMIIEHTAAKTGRLIKVSEIEKIIEYQSRMVDCRAAIAIVLG